MPSFAASVATASLGNAPDMSGVAPVTPVQVQKSNVGWSRISRFITVVLLVAGDVASYLLADLLLLGVLARDGEADMERVFALAAFCAIALHASAALYPGYRLHEHEQLRRRTMNSLKVAALAAVGAILLPQAAQLLPATIAFLFLGLICQPATHWIMRGLSHRLGLWGEWAVILAPSNRMPALIEYFTKHWHYGIRPESFSDDKLRASLQGRAAIALIAGDTGPLIAELGAMRRDFAEVILLSDTPSFKITGLRPADVGGEIGVRLVSRRSSVRSHLFRRFLDLAIAVPVLLVTAPLILIAAAAIYVIDPGAVFFRHTREGLAGKPVHVLKLRTMYRDAEQRLEAMFRDDPSVKDEWSTHFKLKRDPRILPVIGHLLRATSIDELPQLLNIIGGEMAIVGPRPFPEYHLRAMDGEFRDKRRSVTPGLTGLWQISARSNADIDLQQQLDEFYIDNRSLWFDWHILLKTIPAVLRRDGAY